MIVPEKIEAALKKVKDQTSFVQSLLIDVLGWPIDERAKIIDDIAYEWTETELQAAGLTEKIVGGKAYQIILPGNPWGIFILEFVNPDVFTTGRGMTGVLRRVLNGLVLKKRGSRDPRLAGFTSDNLLFVCNHNYERYRFAHFKPAAEGATTAPMVSFGWGPDDLHALRTICEFNLRALEWPDVPPVSEDAWLQAWSPAFDVEEVTKQFYKDYAAVFQRVEDLIAKEKTLRGDELRLFTQSLFNRLMFLRFIERKGWLKFPGQQGTRYLAALANAGGVGSRSLYASRLRPLFFEGLAEEGKQKADTYGSVPLLNGGLFEKSPLDDKVPHIPNEAFAPVIGTDGLFYKYNFTVEESTPLDIEVAVDPEMLGKVFEELVTGRHESGSYYTPRPVVAFMCREALKGHLADRTGAPEKGIARLVDDHDPSGLTEGHPKAIIEALDNLKAVDPACGSGAYLLGLLQELIAIRRALQSEKLAADPGFLYDLKLHIISYNLYGVDIDPFATEIAKLRLWLSLAVEADKPVPLPNLDFKIETGDSLLGPCDTIAPNLQTQCLYEIAEKLVGKVREHVLAHGAQKHRLYNEIVKFRATLRRERDDGELAGIDWFTTFPEAFVSDSANPGFDIALANPPYVRQELITSLKPVLKQQFPEVYAGAADLYVYFYARGIQLLREGGYLSYIAPNKFFRATYGEKLRSFMLRKTHLRSLIDFTDYPIFQAITYPAVVVTKKCSAVPAAATLKAHNWDHDHALNQLTHVMANDARQLRQDELGADAWRITDSGVASVMAKLRSVGKPLGDVVNGLYYGIKTGRNEVFEIDEATRNELVKADAKSKTIIKPWLRGRNVGRWAVAWDNKYLVFTRRGIEINDYPAIKKYLARSRALLEPRPVDEPTKGWKGRKPGTYMWYEVQDAIDYWKEFDKPKIVYQVIATYQQFAYTDQPFVSNDKTWIIPDPPAGLLAYLNSKVAWFFLDQVAPKLQGGAFELRSPAMAQVPVPALSKKLVALEEKALAAASSSSDKLPHLEDEIDKEVVERFNLSKKDVAVIDAAIEEAGNRFPRKFRETEAYKSYVDEMFGGD